VFRTLLGHKAAEVTGGVPVVGNQEPVRGDRQMLISRTTLGSQPNACSFVSFKDVIMMNFEMVSPEH
jgi:hypothetical protein